MKTIIIDPKHIFTSGRGESESVADALKWYEENMASEEGGALYSPADLIVYAVRRLRALHKDQARCARGKLASRLYSPRLDPVKDENIPKALTAAVDSIEAVKVALAPKVEEKPKKVAKVEKSSKAAPPAKSKGPIVHVKGAKVVGKVAPPAGGAKLAF